MYKRLFWITGVLLVALILAPGAAAQASSPEEVVQAYYAALGESAVTGDFTGILDLFAEDATLTVPALSPQPIVGKEMMQATFAGMSSMLKGMNITVDEITTDGDQVTVNYRMTTAQAESETPATDTFEIKDGKIQALTIEIAAQDAPVVLPTTGAAGLNLLPGLLVLGGGALVALGRRLQR